jgi:hypothetical protein
MPTFEDPMRQALSRAKLEPGSGYWRGYIRSIQTRHLAASAPGPGWPLGAPRKTLLLPLVLEGKRSPPPYKKKCRLVSLSQDYD